MAASRICSRLFLAACTIGLAVSGTPARAEGKASAATLAIKLFDRALSMPLPNDFTPVFREANAQSFLLELLPKAEKLTNWRRMITISAAAGVGRSQHLTDDIARMLFGDSRGGCRSGYSYTPLGDIEAGEGITAVKVLISCASLAENPKGGASPALGEQAFIIVARDSTNLYTIQIAERQPAFEGKTGRYSAEGQDLLSSILPLELCASYSEREHCNQVHLLAAAANARQAQ